MRFRLGSVPALSASVVALALCVAPGLEAKGKSQDGGEKSKPRADSAPKKSKAASPKRAPRRGKGSESIGSPTDGALHLGVRLSQSSAVKLRWPSGSAHFGTPELVKMLKRGASKVATKYPGAVMVVGDISAKEGGKLSGHASHTSGRDADVGFYYVDAKGRTVRPARFLSVDWKGHAVGAAGVRFDVARNWAMVQSWVTDPRARVQHIFVAKHLRSMLLKHATKIGAYLPVRHRAAIAMKQPSGAAHDNHFHVRISCPRGDRECVQHPRVTRSSKAGSKKKGRRQSASRKAPTKS